MKNIFLIILILLLIPNGIFLGFQLTREHYEMNLWNPELKENGMWISRSHPAVSKVNIVTRHSGIVTKYSDDYLKWELTDLEIVAGDSTNRDFSLTKIKADSNKTKYYLTPSSAEVDLYLKSILTELEDNGFLVSNVRDNVIKFLRQELTREEFDRKTKLGNFVEIYSSKNLDSQKININEILIRNE